MAKTLPLVLLSLVASLILFGCLEQTYRPAAYSSNATPAATQIQTSEGSVTEETSQVAQQTEEAATRQTTAASTQSSGQSTQPTEPIRVPGVQYFTIEADDAGIYPSQISVSRGWVELTMMVRREGVYYNGLQFRSPVFTTGRISPGGNLTVVFNANRSFTISTYWPSSNVKKADAQVVFTS